MRAHKGPVFAVILGLVGLTGCGQTLTNSAQKSVAKMPPTPQSASIEEVSDVTREASIQEADESERLGTKWGDEVNSQVTSVDLRRTSKEPIEQIQINYADKNYQGRALNSRSLVTGKIDFSVAADSGQLPLYRDEGNYYLQGKSGEAYRLVYRNNSSNTYEIVASVDGLNVLNGSTASRYDSGYVLRPNGELVIEGFRKSQSAVASFIFSKPDDAYAANTSSGSIKNTGVIGTVIYELYDPSRTKPLQPQAFPADGSYAKPPK